MNWSWFCTNVPALINLQARGRPAGTDGTGQRLLGHMLMSIHTQEAGFHSLQKAERLTGSNFL